MPIVIKGAKLTPEFTEDLKEIIKGVEDLRSNNLATRAREVDGGVQIPCGYKKLLTAIQAKYPSATLTPLDESEARKNCIDRNQFVFSRFKEFNAEYLKTDKNVLLQVVSSPGELMDQARVIEFLTKALSKITPCGTHKFKIFAKHQVLKFVRESIESDTLKAADGKTIKGRCTLMPIRYNPGGRPQRGTRIDIVVPAADAEDLFAKLSADDFFERIPSIRFINLENRKNVRRERQGGIRDGASRAEGRGRKTKQQKHREGKAQGPQGKKPAKKEITVQLANKKKGERPARPAKLPWRLVISNIPDNLDFDILKNNLDAMKHSEILKAIAESRQGRSRTETKNVIFYCTAENGKILVDAFNSMEVNNQNLTAELQKAD